MSHVEVNHILRVGPLDRDGKGLERVEGEGNQTSYCMVYWPPQKTGLNFELQKARVACIEPVWDIKKRYRYCTYDQKNQSEQWNKVTFVFFLDDRYT